MIILSLLLAVLWGAATVVSAESAFAFEGIGSVTIACQEANDVCRPNGFIASISGSFNLGGGGLFTCRAGGCMSQVFEGSGLNLGGFNSQATEISCSDGCTCFQDDGTTPCGSVGEVDDEDATEDPTDIVATARSSGAFSTLVAALQAADLVGALQEPGPFTLFAPSEAAFAALPPGYVIYLLKPENKDTLAEVLLYHVVAGVILSTDLVDGAMTTTLQGGNVTVTVSDDSGVQINKATVTSANINATNGVIHVIDQVLIPSSIEFPGEIVETAVLSGSFPTLIIALTCADLIDTLSAPDGPFTVFAPSEEAFAALPAGALDILLKPENKELLKSVLLHHVVSGDVLSTDLVDGAFVPTLNGDYATVSIGDTIMIDDSTVSAADIIALNGVLHVIDQVLFPPGFELPIEGGHDTIMDYLEASDQFTLLTTAIAAAGLTDALRKDGPFTLFAPTDKAFEKLPEETLNAILADPASLSTLLLYHLLNTELPAEAIIALDGEDLGTLSAGSISIMLKDGMVYINESQVTEVDIGASNGVMHAIDAVLVPTLENADSDIPPELLGVWVGDVTIAGVEEDQHRCGRAIFQKENIVNWVYHSESCEHAGVNQVTGGITGDWFGHIRLDSVNTENIVGWECMECYTSGDDTVIDETLMGYEVTDSSCGKYYVQNVRTQEYQCVLFQTSLLKKEEVLIVDDAGRRLRRNLQTLAEQQEWEERPSSLIVNSLTYGMPSSPILPVAATCPAFEGAVGSVQLIIQQTYDDTIYEPSNWACYHDTE